jgi:hypothetical protein
MIIPATISVSLILALIAMLLSSSPVTNINLAHGLDIDVKCTIFENDDVDVRIYALGLNANSYYTAEVVPDESSPLNITGVSDSQGIFWAVAKVNNGNRDSIFNVTLHEGHNASGRIVIYGDDREPCHQILSSD